MLIPLLYMVAAVLIRLLPHPWNLTPVGAMFLFGGATFRTRVSSLAIPFMALLASDFLIVRFLYHGSYNWLATSPWPGFLCVGLIGWALRDRITWPRVVGASLAGSVTFFLVSNFTVWMTGTMYPVTLAGLSACYVNAIPFFRNTAVGDLLYAAVFFGSYELICRHRRELVPAAEAR